MLSNIIIDPSIKFQEKIVNLNGSDYRLTIAFNSRVETWYFDFEDVEGNVIVKNKPLVLGANLLKFLDKQLSPDGFLAIFNYEGKGIAVDGDNLGKTMLLVYGLAEA
jgi:hypothetical protein